MLWWASVAGGEGSAGEKEAGGGEAVGDGLQGVGGAEGCAGGGVWSRYRMGGALQWAMIPQTKYVVTFGSKHLGEVNMPVMVVSSFALFGGLKSQSKYDCEGATFKIEGATFELCINIEIVQICTNSPANFNIDVPQCMPPYSNNVTTHALTNM